jgi:hypothetical protein
LRSSGVLNAFFYLYESDTYKLNKIIGIPHPIASMIKDMSQKSYAEILNSTNVIIVINPGYSFSLITQVIISESPMITNQIEPR